MTSRPRTFTSRSSIAAAAALFAGTCIPALLGAATPEPSTVPATARATKSAPAPAAADAPPVLVPADVVGAPSPFYRPPFYNSAVTFQTTPIPTDAALVASCVLQIDSDVDYTNGGTRADASAAVALLSSTALLDPAAEKVLGFSPAQRRQLVIVNLSPAGGANRLTRVEVALRKNPDGEYKPDAAGALLSDLTDRLKSAFAQSARAQQAAAQARRAVLEKELAAARARADELKTNLRTARTELGTVAGSYGYGGDAANVIANLRNQKQSQEQEIARMRARLRAIEPAAAAGLAGEWEEIVKTRQQRVDELKLAQAQGRATTAAAGELASAQAKLDDAKIRLAAIRQTEAANNYNSGRNTEAAQYKASIAEAEARLQPIKDQLAKLEDPKLADLLERMPEMQQEEQRLRSQISDLTMRLDNARRSAPQDTTVTITVLDGSPEK